MARLGGMVPAGSELAEPSAPAGPPSLDAWAIAFRFLRLAAPDKRFGFDRSIVQSDEAYLPVPDGVHQQMLCVAPHQSEFPVDLMKLP